MAKYSTSSSSAFTSAEGAVASSPSIPVKVEHAKSAPYPKLLASLFRGDLIQTVKNGGTYDQVEKLLYEEGGKRGLKQISEAGYNAFVDGKLTEAPDDKRIQESVDGYNTLVADALTAAVIYKRPDIFDRFVEKYDIDLKQENSTGNSLQTIISSLPNNKDDLFVRCKFLQEAKEGIKPKSMLSPPKDLDCKGVVQEELYNFMLDFCSEAPEAIPTIGGIGNLWWRTSAKGLKLEKHDLYFAAKLEISIAQGLDMKTADQSIFPIMTSFVGRCSYENTLQLMLEYGADVNIKNNFNESILMYAARGGNIYS